MSSRLSELSSSSTTKKFSSIDELRASRRRYVTEARENGFEDGLRTLLADLYPDNAHFIYELLQNAEDAGATAVDFNLERDRLIVSHDGERRFLLDDIAAITGIGQSGGRTTHPDRKVWGRLEGSFRAHRSPRSSLRASTRSSSKSFCPG